MMPKHFIAALLSACVAATAVAATEGDFVNNWLILGTFDNDAQNTGFKRAWINEANAAPREGAMVAGKKWTYFDDRLFSRNYDDYQDLLSYFKIKRNESVAAKVVYAHTYIFSPDDKKAVLLLGADSEAQVWLNGAPVLSTTIGQWKKDSANAQVELKTGWNSLLVKVANIENTRLGFYLGFSNRRNQPLKDLIVSVNGPAPQLAVATGGMPEIGSATMPTGWREWPYIAARPDRRAIYPPGSEQDDQKWILKDFLRAGTSDGFLQSEDNVLQATNFSFQAQGGKPPYRWTVADGDLPPGLTLASDGRIEGTISADAELKEYTFAARVKDANGTVGKKPLSIVVKERPNRWFEEARLACLIHGPEFVTEPQIKEMASLARKQGYQVVMPISYNNGEMEFRWPSAWAPKGTRDTVGLFKKEFEAQGITFGMYMGNLNLEVRPKAPFKNKEQHLMMEEAIRKYKPRALWFDWPTWPGEALDALYSMIRVLDPEIVIVLNGHTNASNGDWDIISFEAWGAWGFNTWAHFPVHVPWPKKAAPESWRRLSIPSGLPATKDFKSEADWIAAREYSNRRGTATDPELGLDHEWKEYYRVHIAMIGEGCIANMDFSLGSDPNDASKKGKMVESLSEGPHYAYRVKMANWASPEGLLPLYPSFTQVNPGPLSDASWGYDLINLKKDAIYLHFQKNPRGKKGLPEEPSVTVGPIDGEVKSVTWMNANKPLPFTQQLTSTNKNITIDLADVTQDEIDTIFKIELKRPLEDKKISSQIPPGNLASLKQCRMFGLDGKTSLTPSAGLLAKYGNDGDPETAAVGGGSWAWIYQVDLERVHKLTKVVLHASKRGFGTHFEIQLSDDGETWTKVADAKGTNVGERIETTFQPTEARYVRLRAVKPDGPNQIGGQMTVAELEVYE